jgi:hypothetical protein
MNFVDVDSVLEGRRSNRRKWEYAAYLYVMGSVGGGGGSDFEPFMQSDFYNWEAYSLQISISHISSVEARGSVAIKALYYKPEGRGFETR